MGDNMPDAQVNGALGLSFTALISNKLRATSDSKIQNYN